MGKLLQEIKYSYRDVSIVPAKTSSINHRCECNPWNEENMLPLFTAPMDSVVGINNYQIFEDNKITPIIPRTEVIEERINFLKNGYWVALSLSEFEEVIINQSDSFKCGNKIHALIDVANGHMQSILDLSKKAKKIYGDTIVIMAGNIANPETYYAYYEAGIDYVRCSIGSGNCCISSSQLGVHYGIASLINEIYQIKQNLYWSAKTLHKKLPMIVADGGIRNYSDVVKALSLGSDYVMCGSIFSKMIESNAKKEYIAIEADQTAIDNISPLNPSSFTYQDLINYYSNLTCENGLWYGDYTENALLKIRETIGLDTNIPRTHNLIGQINATTYGMASKYGQIAINGKKTRTSEGIKKVIPVEYSITTWVENMADYLRSAMSYCNAKTLDEFRENTTLVLNSPLTYDSINK